MGDVTMGTMETAQAPAPAPARTAQRRRPELASFLRTRRARLTPADVGMAPGLRRRTPGLRREEVAQLSGVGVTWYTWLEQGRPINASAQVLDAIARTLRLDQPEREHLYHLAEVPFTAHPEAEVLCIPPEVQGILDALAPRPAVVYNARYDILATNTPYRALFFRAGEGVPNALWRLFTARDEECPLAFRDQELPVMVATMRSAYGLHAGEPAWETFVTGLSEASPMFARLWKSGDVVEPGRRVKVFRNCGVGELRMTSMSLSIDGMPECRIVVYTPSDEESAERTRQLTTRTPPL
ncbi:XRE family transcriptional regulator [Streptomyces acidiscabies]|uniref:XRE family transcriptional regulator n=2 Tax=Streptomyces acidiscabies TaxID=42234 RepID=A0A0L0JVD3_9ACTN|nr:XRE family transcriptional regulator [Streptomyces acidiscabies]